MIPSFPWTACRDRTHRHERDVPVPPSVDAPPASWLRGRLYNDEMLVHGSRRSAPARCECTWCRRSHVKLTDDHVFPRLIGGTLELSLPACRRCQGVLSKAEAELGRSSIFALYTIDAGPPGRDKRDPESGLIRTQYALVKYPDGGYNEVVFKAGREFPITLPTIQINPETGNGWVRGDLPEDVDRLREALSVLLSTKPDSTGFVEEVSVTSLGAEQHAIASDSEFYPRIFLDLGGRLQVRARSPEESVKFSRLLFAYLQGGAFRDHSSWTTRNIVAGTPHHIRLAYNNTSVLRVVAKIAYGTYLCGFGPSLMASDDFQEIRNSVLAGATATSAPITEIAGLPGTINSWPDHHVAAIGCKVGRLTGIVSLYGARHVVDFGPVPSQLAEAAPITATCRRKGGETRLLNGAEGTDAFATLSKEVERLGDETQCPTK